MNTNQEKLNADTLFAFEMALKGHKQFEYLSGNGDWYPTFDVSAGTSHRIYHELPSPEWTRHDGEDWKGDKDAVIEEVMFCDGRVSKGNDSVAYWVGQYANSFTRNNHAPRIYAYKLAKPAISIPEGFTKWERGECPVAPYVKVIPWVIETIPSPLPELVHKQSGDICTISVAKKEGVLISARGFYNYDQILAHFTRRQGGEVCGREEV